MAQMLSTSKLTVWPQGARGDVDDLTADGHFDGRENPKELPPLTERMLCSEAVWTGGPFVTVIAAPSAQDVMSRV